MFEMYVSEFGVPPSVAIGTDIAYAAVTKVFGSWRHFRQGSVDKPLALWLACSHLDDYPGAVQKAVAAGGDTDTLAAIVGGIVAARCCT